MIPDRLPPRIAGFAGFPGLNVHRWTPADAPAMEELITDSLDHLRPWMRWAAREPLPIEQRLMLFDRWDQYWADGHGAVYGCFIGTELIGGCSLHRRVGPGGLDIGYWLGRRHTGRGHATNITRSLLNAAFACPGITFVHISHAANNPASGRVPERLGLNLFDQTPIAVTWQLTLDEHRAQQSGG